MSKYTLRDGRRIRVLGEGRLVNLAAAEGHPPAVMDMSFANQALGALYIRQNHNALQKQVYAMPAEIDREVARLKLDSMGIRIDTLTASSRPTSRRGRKAPDRYSEQQSDVFSLSSPAWLHPASERYKGV